MIAVDAATPVGGRSDTACAARRRRVAEGPASQREMAGDQPAVVESSPWQWIVMTTDAGALAALGVATRRQISAAQIGQRAGDRGERIEVRHRGRRGRYQFSRVGVAW